MWMYIWFEVWNSVCWNDGSVKIVAGPSDHQGKGFSRTDNNLAGQGPRSGAYFEDCHCDMAGDNFNGCTIEVWE